jgi:hypothetical protein
MTPSNASALQTQIDNLGERMDKGFDEIKALVRSFDDHVRVVEMKEAGCQPITISRLDSTWRRLDDHEVRFVQHDARHQKLDRQLGRAMSMYGIFVFISSALGLSVIALIWSLLTGQATVVFK